jgi:hypothetical protein
MVPREKTKFTKLEPKKARVKTRKQLQNERNNTGGSNKAGTAKRD